MVLTQQQTDNIINLLADYINTHDITFSEQVFQNDEANLDCQNLVSDMIDVLNLEKNGK